MRGLYLIFCILCVYTTAYSLEEDFEMDDFEDSLWDTLKKKSQDLLIKEKKLNNNMTQVNSTQNNNTQSNITKIENSTKSNTTSIQDQRFATVVESVIKGYERIINSTQKEVEHKKGKLQGEVNKISKDVTVMKQQLMDIESQIKEKIKEIEVSQEAINKQQTSLSVFEEQLKKNGEEKDIKLKEQLDKDLRQTIQNAKKQKIKSENEQKRLIVQLRRLYRHKKVLLRDIKDKEQQSSLLTKRVAHIEELTELKVKNLQRVVSWMKKKLETRKVYIAKLEEVRKSINETLPLLESEFTTPSKKIELTETINQLKKVQVATIKQIKNLRIMLAARVGVYNKSKIVRIAYETRRDRLNAQEKEYRKQVNRLNNKITKLRVQINEQTGYLKKQTVEVLKDIAASKLSELRGEYNSNDNEMRKVQRRLSFLSKAQIKARKDYDEDLKRIQKEYQKIKVAAFKKAKKDAIREKRRMERRIERLERAMTNKKYTSEQSRIFSEKAKLLRKKVPEINKKVQKANQRLIDEQKRIKEEREKQYRHLKVVAKELKSREDDLSNEASILREKISQTSNKLEKSGLIEDLHDVVRRLATAHARASIAIRGVEKIENKIFEELKNELRSERKMVRVLIKSKERATKRIVVLKNHNEYAEVVDELQHRVEELSQQINLREKKVADIESKVSEATRKRNEDIKIKVIEAKSHLSRLRSRKEEIADELNRILQSSKSASIEELKKNTLRMKQLKQELVVLNNEENKVRSGLEQLNKVIFIRSIDEKTVQAARKSRELIKAMKKSSKRVRKLRSKLVNNKRLIEKLYKSVHETGDIISERAEDKMEQLKNVRELIKNKLKKVMHEHKKLQNTLLKHVERVKRLSKFRIHNFQKQHAELLKRRNELLTKKKEIKKNKGTEYFYTQIDLLDERMNEVLRDEKMYKLRLKKRLNKMVAIAKECEKKTPNGLEGIKVKCTICRNLAAFLLQKVRRDRMSPKEVMKKMYNKCESSSNPALCLRTSLKLSTVAFQEKNKDLTPKELCYKVGRCVLHV
ncbi:hypothetical protein EDI_127260 [Entamoeba dispar SAW760]|uniref:2-alkenal reductase (NAD(P)(+)) n=1 Tax=Entamoeba dispar (strain ATCC PRA-260 / SAW760) TaxID=370354 RepID=B0E8H9_ENTDS|nr:uncharacterized protein EDI_127260 [Entamoeba dispar SAW760]EDR29160.1 hypothetical protein EDI_127260 [Entamoeba dispar SAW760]|eukprot:EDR29160.1 hypothetical protein EDI_127260 [Entamoeba dispar SAW760]